MFFDAAKKLKSNNYELIRYLKQIRPYFNYCLNKNVLEIAPFMGTHTQLIEESGATTITLVELNDRAIEILYQNYPNHTVIQDDIFHYLQTKRNFDVVVCCGLLYHLHSPLYLLELVVNNVNPEYFYIETYLAPISFDEEPDNERGMRQIKENYKSARLRLMIPNEILITAMKNMGYEMIDESYDLPKPTGPVKLKIFKKL